MEEKLVKDVLEARRRALDDARPEAVARVHAEGQLTARERLASLLDSESFVEYGVLAGATSDPSDDSPADGLVAGAGRMAGQPVVAASYDQTVRGGTQSDRNQRKLARLIYLANTHRWPFVCFVDGDGARPGDPPPGPPIIVSMRGRWDLYDGLAELSGWAPTVAIVSGRAVDGNAGIAMLSDFVVATRGSSFGSWEGAGPAQPILRPVEDYARTGNVDLVVDDEAAAIAAVRSYLSYYLEELPSGELSPTHQAIGSIVPDNRRRPYDMREVITAFADAGSVFELRPDWGQAMLTVLARPSRLRRK